MQLVHTRKKNYDAVFWVAADEPQKFAHRFQAIAIQLGLQDAADLEDAVVSRNLVLDWLSTPVKKLPNHPSIRIGNLEIDATWLLILDNADILEYLAYYWSSLGNGSVLVTSRYPFARSHFYCKSGFDLQPFSTADAAALP